MPGELEDLGLGALGHDDDRLRDALLPHDERLLDPDAGDPADLGHPREEGSDGPVAHPVPVVLHDREDRPPAGEARRLPHVVAEGAGQDFDPRVEGVGEEVGGTGRDSRPRSGSRRCGLRGAPARGGEPGGASGDLEEAAAGEGRAGGAGGMRVHADLRTNGGSAEGRLGPPRFRDHPRAGCAPDAEVRKFRA